MLEQIAKRYNTGFITTYDPYDFYNPNTRTINRLIADGKLEVYDPNKNNDFAQMVQDQNPEPLQSLNGWFYGTNAIRPVK